MAFLSLTRVLEALLIFSLSMSLDVYIGFSDRFVKIRPGVPLTLTAALLICLFAIRLIQAGVQKTPFRKCALPTVPFALLVVWAGLSLFVAPRPDFVMQALPGYVTAFLLYLYAMRLMRSPDDIRFTVKWISIAVLFGGGLALLQYASGGTPTLAVLGGRTTQIVQDYRYDQISRVSGLLHHPNTFALFLNGFLPLLLIVGVLWRERTLRWLCLAAFALGIVALILTYSRGGWLSFAVATTLIVIVLPKGTWRPRLETATLAIVLLLLATVLVATPLFSRLVTRVAEDDEGAAQSRIALIRGSADLVRQHPIAGVGLNNYQFVSPLLTDDRRVSLIQPLDELPMRVHNLFLLTAVELGAPGVLLLGVTVALFFVPAIAVIRRGTWLRARVALGFTCGLVAILTQCMVEPATLADPSYLVLAFVGGCVTGIGRTPANG